TMLFHIDEADPRPIYVQIMDEVRRGLITGKLKRGDPLPSVREMAADLSVNPNTVKQAYRELEREGLAEPRRGEGTFVADAARVSRGERRSLARGVAERALWEAIRHGLSAEEFLAAAKVVARQRGMLGEAPAAAVGAAGTADTGGRP
ncbi:MAG: GntR family transcriptional regulator, partial [Gemmatimonadota bacterium]